MEDLKGLIYIVGFLAWMGYSYYNKKKKEEAKKSQRQAPYTPKPSADKDFSTILDEILKEAKAKEGAKQAPKPQPAKTSPVPTYSMPDRTGPIKEQPYEFGHYETMEDNIEDEESPYAKFATKDYKPETLETISMEIPSGPSDGGDVAAAFDEHYLGENTHSDDYDFDMERAIVHNAILSRPKF